MAIFQYTDCDGESVEVLSDPTDPEEDLVMLFRTALGERGGVRLPRDIALVYRNALTHYLGEDN